MSFVADFTNSNIGNAFFYVQNVNVVYNFRKVEVLIESRKIWLWILLNPDEPSRETSDNRDTITTKFLQRIVDKVSESRRVCRTKSE